jgi:hypothetical protein
MGANLRIGATVDVAELKAGMQQSVDEVKQAAQKIPLAFEEARGRTKTALNGISEDTKQAAQVVSIESAKVAQATKQFAQAQAELRNATIVAKDAKLTMTLNHDTSAGGGSAEGCGGCEEFWLMRKLPRLARWRSCRTRGAEPERRHPCIPARGGCGL